MFKILKQTILYFLGVLVGACIACVAYGAESTMVRVGLGSGVTVFSVRGLLTETANMFQLIGSIVGPILVIATLVHVIIKIRMDLKK